jgi:hypothetical protein
VFRKKTKKAKKLKSLGRSDKKQLIEPKLENLPVSQLATY